MIITPVSGNAVRHEYFGIGFDLNPASHCNEAWLAKLKKIQKSTDGFEKLPDKDRAELNARALVGTVITNHDTFTDASDKEWSYLGKSDEFESQTEELLIKDAALRSWVYETFQNINQFEDKDRAEVVKKY